MLDVPIPVYVKLQKVQNMQTRVCYMAYSYNSCSKIREVGFTELLHPLHV